MKQILLISAIVMLIGCSKNEDPFSIIDLNKMSRKQFVKEMLIGKILTEPDEDSTSFRYYLPNGKSKIPLEVNIGDSYNFGKVRKFEINFGGDKKFEYSNEICRGCAPRSKKDVDKIFELYLEMYGKPDSLTINPKYKYKHPWGALIGEKPTILDKSVPPAKRATWIRNGYNLSFKMGYPIKKQGTNEFIYGANHDSEASIIYEMENYKDEMKRLEDSIRVTLTPNDLFTIYVDNPKWYNIDELDYDNKCVIGFGDIHRKDREESKRVKAIRYDIVISDSFKKELYRVPNQTFEFTKPIANMTDSGIEVVSMNRQYILKFDSHNPNAEVLENLRKYDETNSIRTSIDIRNILFEDGSILKSKI